MLALMPPPVAPPPASFHTVSRAMRPAVAVSRVPPQPSACALEAGKSTWLAPSPTPSPEPLSPAAAQTVTPRATAVCSASSSAPRACADQRASGAPQLIDSTEGWCVLSCRAWLMASAKPASELGAKYTASVAAGARAPAISMSSVTSPSGPLGSPPASGWAPSTDTATTCGAGTPSCLKYAERSDAR